VRPVRREPTDPRGQRATDPRGQRSTGAASGLALSPLPTILIASAAVVLAFVLGRVTAGGGDDRQSVSSATVASTTTTTRVKTHTVAPGESLLAIASRYRVTADALAAANDINNQNRVFVGQVLTIPPTTFGPAATTTTTTTKPRRE
jgi:LysM repeat protein